MLLFYFSRNYNYTPHGSEEYEWLYRFFPLNHCLSLKLEWYELMEKLLLLIMILFKNLRRVSLQEQKKNEELNRDSDFIRGKNSTIWLRKALRMMKNSRYLNNIAYLYLSIWCLTTPTHLSLDTFFQCCSWFLDDKFFYDFLETFYSFFVSSQFLLFTSPKKCF